MDTTTTLTTISIKGFPLFIEPSALKVSGQLDNYRRIIARFASNIWWHLRLCRPLGIKTVIKAYTFSGETTAIKLPHNFTLTKVATLDDFPTFDSVVNYSIDLFKQILDLHSAPFRVVQYEFGTIHYNQSVWMLDISGQNAKTFWFKGLETDEEYADKTERVHAGMSNNFIDKSIANCIVDSIVGDYLSIGHK